MPVSSDKLVVGHMSPWLIRDIELESKILCCPQKHTEFNTRWFA